MVTVRKTESTISDFMSENRELQKSAEYMREGNKSGGFVISLNKEKRDLGLSSLELIKPE